MKNAKLNASRWMREAENTLAQAETSLRPNAYNFACFLAEQTAQKALKALRFFDGARAVTTHSIAELIKEVQKPHPQFSHLFTDGAKLDQYYLSTRYPDAVPEPAIPSELYGEAQAKEAVATARRIVTLSKSVVAG